MAADSSNQASRACASGDAPSLRDFLATVPDYVPGRPKASAALQSSYNLSSNENPYPPLSSVLEAMANAAAAAHRYPDTTSALLRRILAKRLAVPTEHIITGTGSVALLQQLVQIAAGGGDEVVFAWRSFEAFPIVVNIAGATAVPVALTSQEGHDFTAMRRAITSRTRVVLICTPNNPTGVAVPETELREFIDSVPRDILVVVDEAYREFVRSDDAVDGVELYRQRPNVTILRTFSKAFGLAGLRVGFAVAHTRVAQALRKTAIPFGVSAMAQAAALASLEAEAPLRERVESLIAERERMIRNLTHRGWAVPPSQGNFLWLRLPEEAEAFAAACAEVGVAVRLFAGEGVRVTVGEPEANNRFLKVAHGASWKLDQTSGCKSRPGNRRRAR